MSIISIYPTALSDIQIMHGNIHIASTNIQHIVSFLFVQIQNYKIQYRNSRIINNLLDI